MKEIGQYLIKVKKMDHKVCCIGQGIIDYVILSSELDKKIKLEKNNELGMLELEELISTLSDNVIYSDIGGAVLNTSIDMAFLGLRNDLVLNVGNKDVPFFRERLSNVPNSVPILQTGQSSGKVVTFVPKERELSQLSYTNAFNYGTANEITLDEKVKKSIKESSLMYTTFYLFHENALEKNEKLLQFAKDNSKLVAIDAGGCKNFGDINDLLYLIDKYVDILFVNEAESRILQIERNLDTLINNGKMVVQKQGDKGSLIITTKSQLYVPAPKIKVVNTLGAGDAYSAGFLLGILKNKSLYDCGILGTKAAGYVIKTKNLRLDSPLTI
jgi:sugar/nucleoside kinase (ribokinase family)